MGRYFAHATHEDYVVIDWKIRLFTPQERTKMAPFRLLPGDVRRVSIEILYDHALQRAAKAGIRLRHYRLPPPCNATEQGGSLAVISLNRRMSN
jgi:hypothetical protein